MLENLAIHDFYEQICINVALIKYILGTIIIPTTLIPLHEMIIYCRVRTGHRRTYIIVVYARHREVLKIKIFNGLDLFFTTFNRLCYYSGRPARTTTTTNVDTVLPVSKRKGFVRGLRKINNARLNCIKSFWCLTSNRIYNNPVKLQIPYT